jgi:acyl-coenzyme A synthetase/AMP-(fatty) acid ligase
VITADQSVRGGKLISLHKAANAAVVMCSNIVKRVFIYERTGMKIDYSAKEQSLTKVI